MSLNPIDDFDAYLVAALADVLGAARGMSPDLSEAVSIEAWDIVWAIGGLGLVGTVHGHPTIADGHRAVTSTLAALNFENGWAITRNRVYALGRRADETLQ